MATPTKKTNVSIVAQKTVVEAKAKVTKAPAASKAAANKTPTTKKSIKKTIVTPEHRYHMIANAAYFLAEKRGFAAGYEMGDWIAAEAQIDAALNA